MKIKSNEASEALAGIPKANEEYRARVARQKAKLAGGKAVNPAPVQEEDLRYEGKTKKARK